MQFFGTKGFFKDYYARSSEPLAYSQAAEWLKIALPEMKLPPQPGQLLPRSALQALLAVPESAWVDPANTRRGPDQPVLRGEFCRAIYQRVAERKR